ncbi:hypothetical protein QTP88_011110 [Uroleucon formosanum]
MLTLASLNSNIKFKEMRNYNKNTTNNISKILIVPTRNYIKINKELIEAFNKHTQRSPVCQSIKKTNKRNVKETDIPQKNKISYYNIIISCVCPYAVYRLSGRCAPRNPFLAMKKLIIAAAAAAAVLAYKWAGRRFLNISIQ